MPSGAAVEGGVATADANANGCALLVNGLPIWNARVVGTAVARKEIATTPNWHLGKKNIDQGRGLCSQIVSKTSKSPISTY